MKQQKQKKITDPAAAQPEKERQIKTQTFIDKEKGIVVRIVRNQHTSKLYVFPVHAIAQNKVTITILPFGNKYSIPDIDFPLVVNDLPEVEGVSVEVG